jgi:hypothetical protein
MGGMERESLDYKIVMDDGPDTEVLGRLASLDIASAAYLQAVVRYPLRSVQLRQAVSEPAAIESAVALFGLDDQKRRRLAVNIRR